MHRQRRNNSLTIKTNEAVRRKIKKAFTILTTSLENRIVKFADAGFYWGHRQIDLDASAVVKCTRINRSCDARKREEEH